MRIGDCFTEKQLKERGFKYLINYGGWQLWGNGDIRIYIEPIFGKINQIFQGGEKRLEVSDETQEQ